MLVSGDVVENELRDEEVEKALRTEEVEEEALLKDDDDLRVLDDVRVVLVDLGGDAELRV